MPHVSDMHELPQRGHCHVNRAWARDGGGRRAVQLCGFSSARFLLPGIEGLGSDFAIDRGSQLMSAGTEVAVNEGVC